MSKDKITFNFNKRMISPGLLLDEFDDPVVLLNQKCCISYTNKACLESLGYNPSDLLGMPFSKLIQASEAAEVESIFRSCLKTFNVSHSFEHTAVSKNGQVEHYKTTAVSGKLSDRKIYIMLHMKSISEQKAAADSDLLKNSQIDAKFKAIVEGAPDPIFIQTEMKFAYLNPAACSFFGIDKPDELVGSYILDSIATEDRDIVSKRLNSLKEESVSAANTIEQKFIRKDGSCVWAQIKGEPIVFKDKAGALIFARDTTKKRSAEEALKKSEQRYEALFKYSTIPAMLSLLEDRKIIEVNDAWTQLFGYDREEAIGKRDTELSDVAAGPESERFIQELAEKKLIKNVEITMYTKTGESLILLFSACVLKNDNVDYVLITYQDITQRVQAEQRAAEIGEKFLNVFDYSAMGMCVSNEKGFFVDVNKRMCSMFDYTKEELEGKHFNDITFSEDISMSNALVEKLISNEVEQLVFEKRYVRKNGEVFWTAVTTTALRNAEGVPLNYITQIQDITEWKHMEQELIAQEKFSRTVMDNLPIGIAVNSILPAVKFRYMNDNFPKFYRTTRDKLEAADSFWDAVYEDAEYREYIKNRVLTDAQSGDKNRMHWENIPITRPGEETSYISAYNTDIQGEDYQISIVTDETERVRSLEALTINAKRFKRLHDFDQEVIKGFDSYESISETVLTYIAELITPDMAHIFICNTKEHILTSIVPEKDSYEFKYFEADIPAEEINNLVKSNKIDVYRLTDLPDCLIKKLIYDKTRNTLGLICPLFNTDGPVGFIYISRADDAFTITDIEVLQEVGIQAALAIEQKRLQLQNEDYASSLENLVKERTAQLEVAIKELEAFTYSVSHDLRAPLRSVSGFVRILMEDYGLKLDEEGQRICNIISSSAQQMGRLIDDLLALSRVGRSSLTLKPVNMQALVKELFVDLTNERLRARIDFVVGELPAAEADPTLIRQVWTNLIDNAIKFSSKVPVARIHIDGVSTEDEYIYSISDNGAGFDMKYQNKLFGIFQRLHSASDFEGTGVGLAIIHRIISRHGGRVWAQAEENKGATFYFSLKKSNT